MGRVGDCDGGIGSVDEVSCAVFFYQQGISTYRLTSFLDVHLAYNSGVAFSLFSGSAPLGHWALVFLTILFLVLLICALFYGAYRSFPSRVMCAFSLFIGGAVGNVWDRIVHGVVVDFISLHLGIYYWPTFNVADICISLGFLLTLFSSQSLSRTKI